VDDLTPALREATHVLSSAGPTGDGDPVLARWRDEIATIAPRLTWAGYLSTTGVYGDHRGGWVDEDTPLTPSTRGMFDGRFFQALKPSAYFINIGRGKSVVTDELVAALEQDRLAGAALDVTDPEPLPPDHPLWRMPDVIITPHISASSHQVRQRFWIFVRENLRRYVRGEAMLNVVDMQKGY